MASGATSVEGLGFVGWLGSGVAYGAYHLHCIRLCVKMQ